MKNLFIRYMFLFTIFSSLNKTFSKNVTKIDRFNTTYHLVELGFFKSLAQSYILIFISELGDKTFQLCLIFSMHLQKLQILILSVIAILSMNYFSISLGVIIQNFVNFNYIYWLAILTFLLYGILILIESRSMDREFENFELKTSQDEELFYLSILKKRITSSISFYYISKSTNYSQINDKLSFKRNYSIKETAENIDNDYFSRNGLNDQLLNKKKDNVISEINFQAQQSDNKIFLTYFISIILAECGDRSQISTIAISSIWNTLGVIIGTSLAQISCIIIAIFLGKIIFKFIYQQRISIITGIVLIIISLELLILNVLSFM